MPPTEITTEETITLKQAPTLEVALRRLASLGLAVAALAIAMFALSGTAVAGVSGQQAFFPTINWGTEPGEFFNPKQLGVDPVDGSVYVADGTPDNSETRIDKFSAAGALEGSVSIPRAHESPEAEGRKGFIGIGVDHALHRFYLVQDELQAEGEALAEERVATKVLVFSTEVTGGALSAPTEFALPAPTSANVIVRPQELAIDPSNGDLIIAGKNPSGNAILQRVSSAGVLGARYEETESKLQALGENPGNFGFTVGPDGTTYIVSQAGGGLGAPEGFTLPPHFQPISGPLALSSIPGFAAAATAEGWSNQPQAMVVISAPGTGNGYGPQIALVSSSDGEETLFFKGARNETSEQAEEVRIHGFSLQQQATTTVYGGGATARHCAIQTRQAAIAPSKEGALVVLDQGQETEGTSTTPTFGPNVLRFGPGGSGCPGPNPAIQLKSGSNSVTQVSAGTNVTLDASSSEISGPTLESLTWTVEGPGGSVEHFPIAGPAPSMQFDHVFATEGSYTVKLTVKTSTVPHIGSGFTAKPVELTVTAPSTATPTVTALNPNHGPTTAGNQVEITGTELTGTTKVEFGTTEVTSFAENTATKIKLDAPPHAAEIVHVTVTTAGGTSATSANDEYTYETPASTAPTVIAVSPHQGSIAGSTAVTITGTDLTGAEEVKFGTTAVTCDGTVAHCKVESATEIKATTPAHAAGIVDVTVKTPNGTSTVGAGDEFTFEAPVVMRTLTINTAGGSGTGTVTCGGVSCAASYESGTHVVLAATPNSGSTFAGWSGGGCSGTAPCTVVLTSDTTVTAVFNLVSSGGGGGGGGATTTPPGNSPPPTITPPPPVKTPAQKLAEKRRKAITKCKKLSGKAKTQCLKKARRIGKPKKKSKGKSS